MFCARGTEPAAPLLCCACMQAAACPCAAADDSSDECRRVQLVCRSTEWRLR